MDNFRVNSSKTNIRDLTLGQLNQLREIYNRHGRIDRHEEALDGVREFVDVEVLLKIIGMHEDV